MSMSVKFNDIELNNYIHVLSGFTPRTGVTWEPQLLEIGNTARGAIFQETTYRSKEIPMPFEINGNIEENYNNLMRVLNVKEPKELIFGDTPNKVYYAVPSGGLDLEEILYYGNGTITWLIPDGVAHSVAEKIAKNYGSDRITLENTGTESVPISIKATMKSDNGYLGFTLDDRFYQIGKTEEVDGVQYEETVKLFDDHLFEDTGWDVNQGVIPPVTSEQTQNGTIGYVKEYTNEGYAKVTNYGSGNSWHGASITKIVPTDENGKYPVNWKCEWRFDFNTDGSLNPNPEIGHNSVTFSDANGNIICSVVFEDNNPSYKRSDMAIYIGKKRVWDTKNTEKFYVTGRGDTGPCASVEKIGNQITVRFSYAGIQKTFLVDDPSIELRKVTWYGAAYKSNPNIKNNLIRALNVRKHNVEKYEDIPNYFANGDTVEISGDTGEVLINGIKDWDTADIGSQPLLLPPGKHTMGIITSSFSSIPDVEVSFRERWI